MSKFLKILLLIIGIIFSLILIIIVISLFKFGSNGISGKFYPSAPQSCSLPSFEQRAIRIGNKLLNQNGAGFSITLISKPTQISVSKKYIICKAEAEFTNGGSSTMFYAGNTGSSFVLVSFNLNTLIADLPTLNKIPQTFMQGFNSGYNQAFKAAQQAVNQSNN